MQLAVQQNSWEDSVSSKKKSRLRRQKNVNSYEIDARYYDAIHQSWNSDLNFWLSFVGKTQGELLEIGGGTGRITIRIAAEGYQITSVEPSNEMRGIAKIKFAEKNLSPHFIKGRLPEVSLPKEKYVAALLPADVFLYCSDHVEQELILNKIADALMQHGLIAFDLPGPVFGLAPEKNGEPIMAFQAENPNNHLQEVRHICYDDIVQTTRKLIIHYYTSTGKEESIHELLYVSLEEIKVLLKKTGFELANVYGNYYLGSYTPESERMIVVAHKREA